MPCVVLLLKFISGCLLILSAVNCVEHISDTLNVITKFKNSPVREESVLNTLVIGRTSHLIISGEDLTNNVDIALTNRANEPGAPCLNPLTYLTKIEKCNQCHEKEIGVYLSAENSHFLQNQTYVWLCSRTRKLIENSRKNNQFQGSGAGLSTWTHLGSSSRIKVRQLKGSAPEWNSPHVIDDDSLSPSVEVDENATSSVPLSYVLTSSELGELEVLQQPSAIHSVGGATPTETESPPATEREPPDALATEPDLRMSNFGLPDQRMLGDQNPSNRLNFDNGGKTSGHTNEVSTNNDIPIMTEKQIYSDVATAAAGSKIMNRVPNHPKNIAKGVPKIRTLQERSLKPERSPALEVDPPNLIGKEGQGGLELLKEGEDLFAEDSNKTFARVTGLRVEYHPKGFEYEGSVTKFLAEYDATIRLFGEALSTDMYVQFTAISDVYGARCDVSTSTVFKVDSAGGSWALVTVLLPNMSPDQDAWYICIRQSLDVPAVHQGDYDWLSLATYSLPLPLWAQILILIVLLILSGLFSGLNLGLMALDKTELEIVQNTGSPTERRYAKSIAPVRRHGNFLLCTLLLGNVLVNSTLTILLDNISTGLIAVIGSTTGIVIFGEIVPQAICSRHGLAIGAKTVWLVRIFMVLTGIIAWPISKILDFVLGEELGNTYDRERLKELIRVTQDRHDIRKEEQNIICGALELHKKTVAEVMTRLEDVYMLPADTVLDFNTISEIMQQGYSRIPIFEGERSNIISVLFIKDLAFIDPDDNTPLRTLTQFYQNPCNFVFEDTTLDVIFREFKEGNKGHMAFVQSVINEGDCDPYYEIFGLVTLEDVIEELIQEEIVDETDVIMDNRTRRRRKDHKRRDFKEFSQSNHQPHNKKVQISPQMMVAALQFLRTSVEPFKEGSLSEGILKKMLTQDIIHVVKPISKDLEKESAKNFIYIQGKAVDYFVLILEGHVEVTIGKESMTFDSGPFTFFGLTALTVNSGIGESPSSSMQLNRGSIQSLDSTKMMFSPDYSVKVVSEVTFLKVRRPHYIAARRAYLLQQSKRDPQAEDNFEKEMIKILKDEGLTSPVWETSTASEPGPTDHLLNGTAVRTRSQEESLEMAMVPDSLARGSVRKSKRKSKGENLSSPATPTGGTSRSLGVTDSCDDLTSLTSGQKDLDEADS